MFLELVIVPGESVAFINIEGIHNLNGINNSITGIILVIHWAIDDTTGTPDGICIGIIEFDTPGIYTLTAAMDLTPKQVCH